MRTRDYAMPSLQIYGGYTGAYLPLLSAYLDLGHLAQASVSVHDSIAVTMDRGQTAIVCGAFRWGVFSALVRAQKVGAGTEKPR